MESKQKELIMAALKVREQSYAPYSGFMVGAAVRTADDRIFTGCNVENASYGATVCGERNAIFSAVAAGAINQAKPAQEIAIVGGKADGPLDFCLPCGICLQVMAEFANMADFRVILAKSHDGKNIDEIKTYFLRELLPYNFVL